MKIPRKIYFPVLISVLLGVTAFIGIRIDPWEIEGPELLAGVEPLVRGAGVYAEDGVPGFKLQKTRFKESARIIYDLGAVSEIGYYKLAGELKANAVIPGPGKYNRARLFLYHRDALKQQPAKYWDVARIAGSRAWRAYDGVFQVERQGNLRVYAGLFRATGELGIRNLTLQRVSESHQFRILRMIIFGFWIALGGVYFVRCLPLGQNVTCGLMSCLVIAILAGTVLTTDQKERFAGVVHTVANSLQTSPNGQGDTTEPKTPRRDAGSGGWKMMRYRPAFYEVSHFLMFAVAAACWLMLQKNWKSLSKLLLLAGLTEILQLYIFGRNASFRDFGIDCLGIVSGFMVWLLIWRGRNRRNRPDTAASG